jgi:hypothetical protein
MAKAGVKSSEFWLSAIAAIVGGVLASGAVSNALALQVLGGAATLLAALGYSTSRAWVKSSEAKADALKVAVEKKLSKD